MITMEILIIKNNYNPDWSGIKFRVFTNNKIIVVEKNYTYYDIKTDGIWSDSYDVNSIETIYINYLFRIFKVYKIKNLTVQEYDLLNSDDSTLMNIGMNYIIKRHRWKSITKKEFKIIRNEIFNIQT